ncbi:MAG: N-acetyltransferase [Candidatus Aminicenantes bacterium]|nr:MAG: N-acetyltransferase [Candidatus Aminicenantes bacterium]
MNQKSKKSQKEVIHNRLKIREETENDYPKTRGVNDLAFGQGDEGRLIEKLRQTEKFIPELSLVAELNDEIIGHILFYPVPIRSATSTFYSLSLAPMAVTPMYQRIGIGSRLVKEGLDVAKKLGHKSVIVVGHPEYYPRFGFKPASQWKIKVSFDVPDEAFLALELVNGELEGKSGTLEFPEEFNEAM